MSTSTVVSSLEAGHAYTVAVFGVNRVGAGGLSPSVQDTLPLPYHAWKTILLVVCVCAGVAGLRAADFSCSWTRESVR